LLTGIHEIADREGSIFVMAYILLTSLPSGQNATRFVRKRHPAVVEYLFEEILRMISSGM